ncbi:hypothetical protein JCM8547_007336 [Rhodosporidiobolus lusitaniae]
MSNRRLRVDIDRTDDLSAPVAGLSGSIENGREAPVEDGDDEIEFVEQPAQKKKKRGRPSTSQNGGSKAARRAEREAREAKVSGKGKGKLVEADEEESEEGMGWFGRNPKELERRRDAFIRAHASTFLALLPGPKTNYITKLASSSPSATPAAFSTGVVNSHDAPSPKKGEKSGIVRPYHVFEQPKAIAGGKPDILKDYQIHGLSFLAYMAENGMNCILADEMGLGKTLQTLSLIAYLDQHHNYKGPHLLVCPLSVLGSWMSEIQRWLPRQTAVRYHGPAVERKRLQDEITNGRFNLIVTTYEAYVAEEKWFKRRKYGLCVLDEGHKIKNHKSQSGADSSRHRRQDAHHLVRHTPPEQPRRALGSPLLPLSANLHPSTLAPFRDSFNLSAGMHDQSFIAKSQKLLELVMLRRTKDRVSGQLSVPPKEKLTLYVPLAPAQVFWYKRLLSRADTMTLGEIFSNSDDLKIAALKLAKKQVETETNAYAKSAARKRVEQLEEIAESKEGSVKVEELKMEDGIAVGEMFGEGRGDVGEHAEGDKLVRETVEMAIEQEKTGGAGSNQWTKMMNLLIQLRKVFSEPFEIDESIDSASSKLVLLDKLLKEILPKGERVLIFSGFTGCLDVIEDFCTLRDFQYARLDGSTSRPRQALDIRLVQQEKLPYQIYLISTRAGGLGINLTAAPTVVLFDQDWNPKVDIQISRALTASMCSRIRKKAYLSAKIMSTMKNSTVEDTDASSGGNEIGQTEDDAPKMGRGAILRGGTGALAAKWTSASGETQDAFSAFRAASFEEIVERGRARYENRDVAIKLDLGEEVSEEEMEKRRKEDEEAERLLLEGREAVQPRKFEGKIYTATNADIAKEWAKTMEVARKGKARTVTIDGHAVAAESLGNARWEAVKTITSNPKMVEKLGNSKRDVKSKFAHEEYCHSCQDGGLLYECTGCPRVYHGGGCSGYEEEDLKSMPMYYCPQHTCHECQRSTSSAGGLLFRCQLCPGAWCEDCLASDQRDVEVAGDTLPELEVLGFGKRSQAYWNRCADCLEHWKQHPAEREQWQSDQAKAEKKLRKLNK